MSAVPAVPTVIDTNVLVPALYSATPISYFLSKKNIVLVWNQFIYDEYLEIIYRLSSTFATKARVQPEEAAYLLELYALIGYKTKEMPVKYQQVSKDRDDDHFLFAAQAGRAEFIITEDSHLLKLNSYNNIPIGTPKAFFGWAKKAYPMSI